MVIKCVSELNIINYFAFFTIPQNSGKEREGN